MIALDQFLISATRGREPLPSPAMFKPISCLRRILFSAALAFVLSVFPSRAELLISGVETDGDVVFTYSGSLDTTGAASDNQFYAETYFIPNMGEIEVWQEDSLTIYLELDQTNVFGTGSLLENVGIGTGDNIGLFDSRLYLDDDYVSGDPLSASLTFQDATFESLGVDTDSAPYVWTLVANGDTIRMVFPDPPVLPPANQNAFANASEKSALVRGIKGLQKKVRKLKKKGKKAKAKKLQKKIKKLRKKLKALG